MLPGGVGVAGNGVGAVGGSSAFGGGRSGRHEDYDRF